MKVIVCFGEIRILVPCDAADDLTVKELCDLAVAKFKKATNKSPDEDIKISYLKTQSEGAMVDPDDKVANVAEDKDIFTAVLEEPLSQVPLVNTSNGQLVLAVINNDGTQSTDSIVNSLQLGSGGNLSNLSPLFQNAIMGMLQQSMSQQQPTAPGSTGATGNPSTLPQLLATPQAEPENAESVENVADEDAPESDNKAGKKEFSCDQCPKKFHQSWKLRQHLIAHARRDEMKKYECDKCAATFISEWLLVRHAKIHTGSTKPRFCLVCNRAFRGSTDLKVHMRVHTGEKPFKCETCGKPFGDRSALRRHTMTHTGEKPRPCPHCPRAFRQTAPLITHMRQRHNIDIRQRCDVCYMSFCEDEPYVMHMANVHHKDVTLEDLKKNGPEGSTSSGLEMEHQDMENDEGVGDEGVVDDDSDMVGADGMVDNVKHSMVDNTHLVQHCEDDGENKDEENSEQVEAERSLQDAYMTESGDGVQGEAITITAVAAGQDAQELVLPADLVVAHQLIAVQQSNMDV